MSWIVLVFAGCNGDPDDPDPTDSPIDTDPPVTEDAPVFVEGPTIVAGGPLVPLSRELHVTMSEPAELELSASDGSETVSWVSPTATTHVLPLVGLHADGAWTLTVHAVDPEQHAADATVDFTTDSLPSPLPTLELVVSDPARMQPGLTLIPLFANPVSGYLTLVDDQARIVWIYGPTPFKFTEVRHYEGHLLALDNTRVTELDWMGNTVRSWTTLTAEVPGIAVDVDHFHHELFETTRGTFVTFTKDPTFLPNFPISEFDPIPHADSQIANDTVLEWDIATGEILGRWEMKDILDPQRLGFESLSIDETGYEWTHMNAASEDAVNGRWVVSCRNQDTIVAFDQTTSEISWILAPHENWHPPWTDALLTPVGEPFDWSYHQHAVKYDPATGRVLMFDNGNYRASPWTAEVPETSEQSHSRVVQYTVDEVARTVRQDWEYRMTPDVFSQAMGDADWLPNGNVLGDFAFVQWDDGIRMEDYGRGHSTVRVVEFEPESGEVVWYLDVWSAVGDDPNAWQAYRAERIPRPWAP